MQQCSKCKGSVSPYAPAPGISMFMCRSCKGTWFPKGMLESYLHSSNLLTAHQKFVNSGHPCKACNNGELMTTQVSGSNNLQIDRCSSCEGIFLDANEIRQVKDLAKVMEQQQGNRVTPVPTGPFQSPKLPIQNRKPAHTGLLAVSDASRNGDRIQIVDLGLLAYSHFFVKQRKEWTEILLNFETRNKYDILNPDGVPIGHAAEHGSGARGFFGRLILGTHRSFTATIWDQGMRPQIEIKRPFFFLFSDMFVANAEGLQLGSIHRRFHPFHAIYEVRDNRGRVFAKIKRPLWRFWKFFILDTQDKETGQINKRWGGLLREAFSSADTYEVNLGTSKMTDFQRAVMIAAAIAIDFDYFETQSKNNG